MLLDAISNDTELELLRILGIELVDGKLVDVKTGVTFVRQVSENYGYGEYLYKCGDITVRFESYCKPYKPIRVWVEKDGLRYCAGDQKELRNDMWEGVFLYINNIDYESSDRDMGQGIVICPEVSRDFMQTDIRYAKDNETYIFRGYFGICCDFNSIKTVTWDEKGKNVINCGKLDVDTYKSILESAIKNAYKDEKLRDAYLKCMPFIVDEFNHLLSFPCRAGVLYEEKKWNELSEVDSTVCDRIQFIFNKRKWAFERLAQEGKSGEELIRAQSKIFMDSIFELNEYSGELLSDREKISAELDQLIDDAREYEDNFYGKKQK